MKNNLIPSIAIFSFAIFVIALGLKERQDRELIKAIIEKRSEDIRTLNKYFKSQRSFDSFLTQKVLSK